MSRNRNNTIPYYKTEKVRSVNDYDGMISSITYEEIQLQKKLDELKQDRLRLAIQLNYIPLREAKAKPFSDKALHFQKKVKQYQIEVDKYLETVNIIMEGGKDCEIDKEVKEKEAREKEAREEEEAKEKGAALVRVIRVIINELPYLKSKDGILYNVETKEVVGMYDEEKCESVPIPDIPDIPEEEGEEEEEEGEGEEGEEEGEGEEGEDSNKKVKIC